jgi:hypothetical protein
MQDLPVDHNEAQLWNPEKRNPRDANCRPLSSELSIIVLNHIRQSRKATVMIEAALLMAPQTCEGRGTVHVRW